MKKIIWTFGLIAGGVMSAFMAVTVALSRDTNEHSLLLGYAGLVAGFLLVFFGIRAYRENVGGGAITFGRAFLIGLAITLIASVCYTATWEVVYFKFMPDFADKYGEYAMKKMHEEGKSEAEMAKKKAQLDKFAQNYKNPFYNAAMTMMEPLPVGLLITLVSAGILRRKRRD